MICSFKRKGFIFEKKLNFGLIFFNTDLKVVGHGNGKAKETLGSFKLLRRRPVVFISLVDYNEGLVFREDIDLIKAVSYS